MAPAWTVGDRALMLAYAEYETSLCPGCGQPIDSAWNPENDGWFEVESRTCHSCTVLDRSRADDPSKVSDHEHSWTVFTGRQPTPLTTNDLTA